MAKRMMRTNGAVLSAALLLLSGAPAFAGGTAMGERARASIVINVSVAPRFRVADRSPRRGDKPAEGLMPSSPTFRFDVVRPSALVGGDSIRSRPDDHRLLIIIPD